MPKKKTGEVQKIEAIPIRLVWDTADNLETIYVNHAAIIHNGPEYYLIFGELVAPLARSIEEIPKEVHITPKVRLAISPEQIKNIAEVIYRTSNLEDAEKEE